MVDLHAHLIPGVDDGPEDMEASLAMLRSAEAAGTRVIAATPHLRADFPLVRGEAIRGWCDELRAAIGAGSGIALVAGGEVDLAWARGASEEELRLASYRQAGADLLVETPYGALMPSFESLLHDLVLAGYRVTLAHPELNPTFQADPERLAALVARGYLLQVTARSLTRTRRRSRSRSFARALVSEGIAHVLASDAHSGGSWRPPDLRPGVRAAADLVGRATAEWMVTEAPASVLAGEPLPAPPARVPSRPFFQRVRRRPA